MARNDGPAPPRGPVSLEGHFLLLGDITNSNILSCSLVQKEADTVILDIISGSLVKTRSRKAFPSVGKSIN